MQDGGAFLLLLLLLSINSRNRKRALTPGEGGGQAVLLSDPRGVFLLRLFRRLTTGLSASVMGCWWSAAGFWRRQGALPCA